MTILYAFLSYELNLWNLLLAMLIDMLLTLGVYLKERNE